MTPIVGLFGASTGTAAAFNASAERPDIVSALVSRCESYLTQF
jgi:pimeloyl-ACP methyl ester carboxylesterase